MEMEERNTEIGEESLEHCDVIHLISFSKGDAGGSITEDLELR